MGLIGVLLIPNIGFGQTRLTNIERRADSHYERQSYHQAAKLYKRLINKRPANDGARLKLARTYVRTNQLVEAEPFYAEVIHKKYLVKSIDFLDYAQLLQSLGKYQRAEKWVKRFLSINPRHVIAQNLISSLESINKYYQDSSRYVVTTLNINSKASEFSPAYYQSGIAFVSSRTKKHTLKRKYSRDNSKFLNLYYSEWLIGNSLFTDPVKLKGPINNRFHQGPATFYNDGKKVIYTSNSATTNQDTDNLLKLYFANWSVKHKKWTDIMPAPFNLEGYSTGHPTLDKTGQVLYFVSDRPEGFGGTDLYKVEYHGNGWGKPINLGSKVNTPGDELFPFVNHNDRLYFASNGHGGLGGLDIFYTEIKSISGDVRNMGFPINSSRDDFGLIYDLQMKTGYFSSNRAGQNDLYQMRDTGNTLNVSVHNQKLEPPVSGVVSLRSNGYLLEAKHTGDDGSAEFTVTAGTKYSVAVESAGSEVIHKQFTAPTKDSDMKLTLKETAEDMEKGTLLVIAGTDKSKSYILTSNRIIEVKPSTNGDNQKWIKDLLENNNIEIEQIVEINPILYDFDRSSIQNEYTSELDKLVTLMKQYQFIQFELGAHTDAIGSKAYNQVLSQQRANSVRAYLENNRIGQDRLLAVGYGETSPTNLCMDGQPCTKNQHQLNRRTEFRLIYMDENQVVSNY